MDPACSHLDQAADVSPSSEGFEDCLRIGGQWVHLRMCMSCGHVGSATTRRTGTPPATTAPPAIP